MHRCAHTLVHVNHLPQGSEIRFLRRSMSLRGPFLDQLILQKGSCCMGSLASWRAVEYLLSFLFLQTVEEIVVAFRRTPGTPSAFPGAYPGAHPG